ncbi:Rne/Rng family ribonuclease [Psittacicella hinzii]|uniref:Ribonuclease G n=1 Tax=Psittacicella hinzii TaxID=2028575 RepID=A0A3A1YF24_9GAMM|nr:Rne/Rng family ribonuclease [Psittacicella hinzii]RIY36762.1 hypothetical protein CKF58_05715 [Psittacicella hinzii]
MRKMLINATQEEEVRIALVEERELLDLDIEQRRNDNKKSNIYIGRISRIESSLEACFVDYGEGRDGFLPFKDIHESYFNNRKSNDIKDRLEVGQKLIVQVAREERGNKGAALTTYIAIASTFLVLMPNSPEVDGISRRLSSGDRDSLRSKLSELNVPEGQGLIVRTAGVGCSTEELRYDLKILHFIWDKIQEYAEEHDDVGILHHESETIIRVIRDYLTKDVVEIIVDSQEAYDKANHYLRLVRPQSKPHLELYNPEKHKQQGLFAHYDIERQIDTAFERTVKLKSGGAIVIDTTEALTAIDVNSSRFTQGGDIESTALLTNLEAAEEIARQLKIRDLGGLIVIDFIDMSQSANQKKVEEKMRLATADDRARIQTSRISKFGLMEVSRQRIRGSIAESNNHVCPRCSGTGFIRDNESLALHILRQITEEVNKRTGRLAKLHVVVPNEIAAYLLNEKREEINRVESSNGVEIVVVPDALLQTPHFEIHRVRRGDLVKDKFSYDIAEYYQEVNRINQRKQQNREKHEEQNLPHNLSSVPDAYMEKTFEARLEKAEFIQEALEREEKEKTLLYRIKNWFVGLFKRSNKDKDDKDAEALRALQASRKRKRSRKKSAPAPTIASDNKANLTDLALNVDENVEDNDKVEKPLSKRALRKQQRDARKAAEEANALAASLEETVDVPKSKVVNDGHVTEEVFTTTKERKRKAKKQADKALADIDPAAVKAQVEAQERATAKLETENAKTEAKADFKAEVKVDATKNAKVVKTEEKAKEEAEAKAPKATKAEVKATKANEEVAKPAKGEKAKATEAVEAKAAKAEESKKEKRKRNADITERYVLRQEAFPVADFSEWLANGTGTEKAPEIGTILANSAEDQPSFIKSAEKTLDSIRKPGNPIGTINSENFNNLEPIVPVEVRTPSAVTKKETEEKSVKESTVDKVAKLRRYIFRSPQPCVNFYSDFESVNRAKKQLRAQKRSEAKNQGVSEEAKSASTVNKNNRDKGVNASVNVSNNVEEKVVTTTTEKAQVNDKPQVGEKAQAVEKVSATEKNPVTEKTPVTEKATATDKAPATENTLAKVDPHLTNSTPSEVSKKEKPQANKNETVKKVANSAEDIQTSEANNTKNEVKINTSTSASDKVGKIILKQPEQQAPVKSQATKELDVSTKTTLKPEEIGTTADIRKLSMVDVADKRVNVINKYIFTHSDKNPIKKVEKIFRLFFDLDTLIKDSFAVFYPIYNDLADFDYEKLVTPAYRYMLDLVKIEKQPYDKLFAQYSSFTKEHFDRLNSLKDVKDADFNKLSYVDFLGFSHENLPNFNQDVLGDFKLSIDGIDSIDIRTLYDSFEIDRPVINTNIVKVIEEDLLTYLVTLLREYPKYAATHNLSAEQIISFKVENGELKTSPAYPALAFLLSVPELSSWANKWLFTLNVLGHEKVIFFSRTDYHCAFLNCMREAVILLDVNAAINNRTAHFAFYNPLRYDSYNNQAETDSIDDAISIYNEYVFESFFKQPEIAKSVPYRFNHSINILNTKFIFDVVFRALHNPTFVLKVLEHLNDEGDNAEVNTNQGSTKGAAERTPCESHVESKTTDASYQSPINMEFDDYNPFYVAKSEDK